MFPLYKLARYQESQVILQVTSLIWTLVTSPPKIRGSPLVLTLQIDGAAHLNYADTIELVVMILGLQQYVYIYLNRINDSNHRRSEFIYCQITHSSHFTFLTILCFHKKLNCNTTPCIITFALFFLYTCIDIFLSFLVTVKHHTALPQVFARLGTGLHYLFLLVRYM